jgi:hypothetical protein
MLGDNTRTKVVTSTTSGGPQKLGGIKINDVAAVEAALKEIGNEKGSVNWILLDYQGDGVVGLTKQGKGMGIPPQDVQNDIDDKKVQYMVFTFMQGVRQYGMFTWVGAKAPSNIVTASNSHKAALHQQLAVRLLLAHSGLGCLSRLYFSHETNHTPCTQIMQEIFMKLHRTQLQSGELRC